jgi:hypothetical protein
MRGNFGWEVLWSFGAGLIAINAALATERDFSIVTSQSSIAASGTVVTSFGTSTIQPQGPGSLTTTYSGTIKTDLTTGSVSFLSGSSVSANVSGSWKPDSTAADVAAPANYGGKVSFLFGVETANVAGRNFVLGATSGPISIDSGGHFDLSQVTLNVVSGNLAYHDSLGQFIGTSDLANKTTSLSGTGTLSSLTQSGQITETLTVPINSTFVLMPDASTTINLTLMGQVVATTTFAAGLPGDFNSDGKVDAADYVAWSDGILVAKTTANYNLWRANFGAHAGSGAGSSVAAVPEASAGSLSLLAFVANFYFWRVRKA